MSATGWESGMTTAGMELIARALANNEQVSYTRMAVGDGEASGEFGAMTSLANRLYDLGIQLVQQDGLTVNVTSDLVTKGLAQGYTLREMGLYAKTKSTGEILFCYTNGGDSGIPVEPLSTNVSMDGRLRMRFVFTSGVSVQLEYQNPTYADFNHRHDNATQQTDGFMSQGDKIILDRINGDMDPTYNTVATTGAVNVGGNLTVEGELKARWRA